MDSAIMAPRLLSALRVSATDQLAFELNVRSMNLKQGRHCLIRYTLGSEQFSETPQLIGKVFARSGGRRGFGKFYIRSSRHRRATRRFPSPWLISTI